MLHLHSRPVPIVHRDLKSPNLLVDENWRVKVADFNLSRLIQSSSRSSSMAAMNPRWLAPEVLRGEHATQAADVFAFGVVMWELLTWELPWTDVEVTPWQLVRQLSAGARLQLPPRAVLPGGNAGAFAGLDQYELLMQQCWAEAASERPPFSEVVGRLRPLFIFDSRDMFAASCAARATSGMRWQPGAPPAGQLAGPRTAAHQQKQPQHQRRAWQPVTTPHRTTVVTAAAAADGTDDELEMVMRGGKSVAVPPELAAGLAPLAAACSLADVAAVARAVATMFGPRQQGVLDHGLAVVAYLQGLGIHQAQLGRLLCRCPVLFSRPSEERAGLLLSQLMRLGLSARQAADCFGQQPVVAHPRSFEAAIAVLAPLLAVGSKSAGRTGEQLLGDLLQKQPAAGLLLSSRAEALQHNVDNLLQLGLSKQQVVNALKQNWALLACTPEHLAKLEAVLQQEMGADRQLWVKVLHRAARVVGCSEATVRQRAQALVADFGKEEALRMVGNAPGLLAIDVIVWRLAMAVWRLCGVSDPLAVACNSPGLLLLDWLNPSRLANLLALQRLLPWELSVAQVIERYGSYVASTAAETLAGRLLYLEQLGLLQLLVADKRAARQEWRQSQQGLSAGKEAGGEPVYMVVRDVAIPAPAKFAGLVQAAEAWLSEDNEAVSTSPSFEEFSKGLKQLPAWQRLWADSEAGIAELNQQLPPELLRALDAACGMLHLHSRAVPIVHRDLKSLNLLVDENWRVKVADFNLSRLIQSSSRSSSMAAMNPRWLAPEVLRGEHATQAADVFAFGVVMWELLTWELPWTDAEVTPWQLVRQLSAGARL
ncbi:hypothetical protein D9Q98_010314 [Chlorella vulgaris]|uniref:Protein kinase domain-containing protein n=1 Tax=Chlorella vulgaris TaxID=3077 RepID=A0A9D4YUV5_CHLVU|nr:hypothetical protein D9Q98_010314 [Chlorella vulgaris]